MGLVSATCALDSCSCLSTCRGQGTTIFQSEAEGEGVCKALWWVAVPPPASQACSGAGQADPPLRPGSRAPDRKPFLKHHPLAHAVSVEGGRGLCRRGSRADPTRPIPPIPHPRSFHLSHAAHAHTHTQQLTHITMLQAPNKHGEPTENWKVQPRRPEFSHHLSLFSRKAA